MERDGHAGTATAANGQTKPGLHLGPRGNRTHCTGARGCAAQPPTAIQGGGGDVADPNEDLGRAPEQPRRLGPDQMGGAGSHGVGVHWVRYAQPPGWCW